MGGLGGDKNSPKTSNASSSATLTKTDNRVVYGGAGSTSVGGNTDISGISGGLTYAPSTTDQGAIAAGLQIAMASLDSNNSALRSASVTQGNATQAAIGVASTVAQGQQNVTFKYVTYIIVGVALAAVAYAYLSKGGR